MTPFIANRYQPLDKLGEGGMGVVYRVKDHLTNATQALKQVLFHAEQVQFNLSHRTSNEFLALALEFRTLATLRHPHIITVMDYGFDHDRLPFFTMEYLPDAQSLTDFAQTRTTEDKVLLLTETLQALAYLHQRGIIHRDIKPGNILVNKAGAVKVLDFGLAMDISINDLSADEETIVGTLAYMAPEILSAEPASIQSDLYAVGMMAYEMFAGQHPYDLSSMMALMNDILMKQPDLSQVDPRFAPFIGCLLAKSPAERPTSAREAINELYGAFGQAPPEESALIRESFLQASAFVGRMAELAQLRACLEAVQDGTGSAWLIGGESGVGKSRLVDELRVRALVDGVRVLRGQGITGGGVPYQIWRDVMRPLLISTAVSDLEASILKEIVPDIDTLLQRPVAKTEPLTGKSNQDRLAQTIIDVFKRQSAPQLLILEDLQWVDESLEPLKMLLDQLGNLSVIVIGTYRTDECPDLPQQLPAMQVMPLDRLDTEAVAALSQSMLGDVGRNPQLVNLLNHETEGNVFFMVEVVRALAEEAGSLDEIGTTSLPQHVMAGGMLQVLRRRLGRMPDWAQSHLKVAAVAGRQLDARVLQHAAAVLDFDALVTAGANAAVFSITDGTWEFAHDKLRETLLDDISDAEKVALHGQVAAAIEASYPGDEAQAEVLAQHWDQAGHAEKALPYILRASEHMINITAQYDRAQRLLERGLVLANDDVPDIRAQLYTLRGDLAQRQAEYDTARTHYETSLKLAAANPLLQVAALNGLGLITWRTGKFEEAHTYATQSQQLAVEHQDKAGEAQSYLILGRVADAHGSFDEAREHLEKSLRLEQERGSKSGAANRLLDVGVTYARQGKFDQAEEHFNRSLTLQRELGVRKEVASNLNNLGLIANLKKDYALADLRFHESLQINREINSRVGVARCLKNLGVIALDQENYTEAVAHLEESLRINREIDNLTEVIFTLNNLAAAWLHLGELTKTRRNLYEGLMIAQQINEISLTLMGIIIAAHLIETEGNLLRSTSLAGFAQAHSATQADVRAMFLDPLVARLQENILPDLYQQAFEQGQELELTAILDELLANLEK